MKKRNYIAFVLFLLLSNVYAQNPYLPLWEHLPDGEPRVFEDPDHPGKYRAYIIGSHDVTYTEYCGPDIRMWSAPVEDLTQWRDEGPIFTYYVNGQWDTMFAPDLVEVNNRETGKRSYYLYPHSRGWRRVPMVCKGDRPDGPFAPINLTPDGQQCLPGSCIDFDPSVFVENISDKKDPDYTRGYRAYCFYGFQHSTAIELDPNTMYSVRPGTQVHDFFLPASSSYGKVRDPQGTTYPALYEGQDPGAFNFFEASSIRQVGNKYVMVFSGYSGPDYGLGSTNSALRYAYGDTPLGPWRSGGVLVDSRGIVPNEDGTHLTTTNAAHNTHGSLQEINGLWYVFYHRPPRGYMGARQAMVAPVKITWDKKPVSQGGQVKITGYDAFTKNNEWTAKASDGTQYSGAEVTSEGFHIFGLPPYHYYSAGYACYMSNQQWLQDGLDNWYNHMELAGITNGGIIGFKYFGFEGLKKDTKGIKSFRGTEKGNETHLCLWLKPTVKESFKIHVMLDGPYSNTTWNGKEIAVIEVPAQSQPKIQCFTADVASAVEGLKGKHAIYLVVEGPEVKSPERNQWGRQREPQKPVGLFDLQGIGFADKHTVCEPDFVPRVIIKADGVALSIPEKPINFTSKNGYAEQNRYQVYGKVTDATKLSVEANHPDVKTEIGKIVDGRATITCTFRGQKKIFLIN